MYSSFQKPKIINQQHSNFNFKPYIQNGNTTTYHQSPTTYPTHNQYSQNTIPMNKTPTYNINLPYQQPPSYVPYPPINPSSKNSPTFSSTTTSNSQHPDCNTSFNTINSYKLPLNKKIQNNISYTNQPIFIKKQLQPIQNVNYSIQSQSSINCAICQQKYKPQHFDYHLQIHKSNNKIKKNVTNGTPILYFPNSNVSQPTGYFGKNQNNFLKKKNQYPIKNQEKQQFLYSFENKCYQNGKIIVQPPHVQNLPPSMPTKFQQKPPPYYTNPIPIQHIDNSPRHIQNIQRIRYINQAPYPPIPAHQTIPSFQQPLNYKNYISSPIIHQPLTTRSNDNVINFQCSQIYNSQCLNSTKQQPIIYSQRKSNQNNCSLLQQVHQEKQIQNMKIGHHFQPIDLFQMPSQQQSKIYQYFPQLKNSISQPQTAHSNQICMKKNQKTQSCYNSTFPKKQQKKDEFNISCFTESSISSIQSIRKPLQTMTKDQLIQTYHINKNRMPLNNIVGMSQAVARQWVNSKNVLADWHNEASKKTRSQIVTPKQRGITAFSMTINQNQCRECPQKCQNNYKKANSNSANMQMIPVQSKQIYRGVQVNEENLQKCNSEHIGVKTIKNTPKVKIPHNYLAMGDFIAKKQYYARA